MIKTIFNSTKRNMRYTLGVSLLFVLLISCSKPISKQSTSESLNVSDTQGIVGYWKGDNIDKYTINVSVAGTIDSQIIGIVTDLPAKFRTEGTVVIFSGRYETSSLNPSPKMGGQKIYTLILSSIKKKE